MKPEEQRIAIAEACGWTAEYFQLRPTSQPYFALHKATNIRAEEIPDYLNDVNAMHEAELQAADINPLFKLGFILELAKFGNSRPGYEMFAMMHSTAAQRAEAFLRTLNLWKES